MKILDAYWKFGHENDSFGQYSCYYTCPFPPLNAVRLL